jgi:hypothetical protein
MKTAEEIASIIYQPIGMSCNEFAIKLAKSYAKEVLEEYTNRIVDNATAETVYELNSDEYVTVNKESITNQLSLMLKEIL